MVQSELKSIPILHFITIIIQITEILTLRDMHEIFRFGAVIRNISFILITTDLFHELGRNDLMFAKITSLQTIKHHKLLLKI